MVNDQSYERSQKPHARLGHISQDDVSVETYRIVAPDGSYDADAVPDLQPDQLRDLYRWMLVERTFDERMVKLTDYRLCEWIL